jgi:hypothetical protein
VIHWNALNEDDVRQAMDERGFAVVPEFVTQTQCDRLAALWEMGADRFRSTISMARHGYGQGEYKYFARPLPEPVSALRAGLYPPLARLANLWAERWGGSRRWPDTLEALTQECAQAGQTRPTPLLLRYGPGDYNRLHQDVYGDLVFPFQAILLLDRPGEDFTGGELVLSEGRPRMQSRVTVAPWRQGDLTIIPVRERPVSGARGWTRAAMRHGVSEIRSGRRRTLGLIFHDAA